MDTIEVKLVLKKGIYLEDINCLRRVINKIQNKKGYRFCDVLEVTPNNDLLVKISYPRYFSRSNAFLITKKSECFEVQETFSDFFINDPYFTELIDEIVLTRVDIPFTFIIDEDLDFHSYKNLYKIFAMVYCRRKGENGRVKGYLDLIEDKYETIVYSDNGKTDKTSNNRLMIYNQYRNLEKKLKDNELKEAIAENPNLIGRIRLEVSKRIRRKGFSLEEFREFDIIEAYYESYKDYILDNILNLDIINDIYEDKIEELEKILAEERNGSSFSYKVFIWENSKGIYDYKILRKALHKNICNKKTRESAITCVRKILRELEKKKNVIILDTYERIKELRNKIKIMEIR